MSCSHTPPSPPPGASDSRWQGVRSFACQFQQLDLEEAARSPFQLLLMDFSRDGRQEGAYTSQELARLRHGGRLLVAYLSVGEAESYRSYWHKSWKPGRPAWLDSPNPDWKENYKVRYWEPAWQQILFDYADDILDQGFDGLFLDVVDAYEYWEPRRPQAASDMRTLLLKLIRHVRERGEIGIFLNSGEGLLEDQELLNSITGVAKEEIFFGLPGDGKPSPIAFTQATQAQLKKVVEAGKIVLSIDYTNDPKQARQAHELARQAGYLEFVGVRALNRLVQQPSVSPTPELHPVLSTASNRDHPEPGTAPNSSSP